MNVDKTEGPVLLGLYLYWQTPIECREDVLIIEKWLKYNATRTARPSFHIVFIT